MIIAREMWTVGTPTGEARQGRKGKQEERKKREEQISMGRKKQEEILKKSEPSSVNF